MNDDLTPFPDGEGYMDHVLSGLSPVQRATLWHKAGRGERPRTARATTYATLTERGLLDGSWLITARGRALVEWAES